MNIVLLLYFQNPSINKYDSDSICLKILSHAILQNCFELIVMTFKELNLVFVSCALFIHSFYCHIILNIFNFNIKKKTSKSINTCMVYMNMILSFCSLKIVEKICFYKKIKHMKLICSALFNNQCYILNRACDKTQVARVHDE